jgi:hypothetical protein
MNVAYVKMKAYCRLSMIMKIQIELKDCRRTSKYRGEKNLLTIEDFYMKKKT